MRKRKPVLLNGEALMADGKVLEFDAVDQEELDGKIDAPQTAQVGEVLTVEDVGEDGKPKKWKTAAVDPKSIKDMYYEGFDAIDTWIHDPDNQHISENNITLSAGEQCTVRIGDDEYKVVAENQQTGRYDYSMVLGTWDFSSVPFYFTIASEYGAEVAFGKLYTRLSDSVTAGTKISLEKNFAHTIKEKYFPKTIFTQENAPVRFGDILKNSAVQGKETVASGQASHAEGYQTTASGDNSHAEGYGTKASGFAAHAEGAHTVASNIYSHAEGIDTKATGPYSHAEGESTVASSTDQHVQGRRNIKDENDKYAHIVGNGNSTKASNAYTLDWEGNAWFAGNVYVGSTSGTNKDDGSVKLATMKDLSTCFRVNIYKTENDDGTVTYVSDVPALSMYNIMFEHDNSGNSIECYINLNGGITVLNFVESHMTILEDGNIALSFKFSSYVSGKHISAEIKDTISVSNTDKEILSTVVTVTENASLPIPATAQVGQIVKVKSVDESGKITETETVDIGSGIFEFWIEGQGTASSPYKLSIDINDLYSALNKGLLPIAKYKLSTYGSYGQQFITYIYDSTASIPGGSSWLYFSSIGVGNSLASQFSTSTFIIKGDGTISYAKIDATRVVIPQPSTANPDQIIRVKSVDESGKITETETVDIPMQKTLKWITVHSSDLTETKRELIISTDTDGKSIVDYNPVGLSLIVSTPADATVESNNGSPWVYPSATKADNAIRVIGNISGWKTVARDSAFVFNGGSSAMSCSGNVNTSLATYKLDGYALDGVRIFFNSANDHLPVGTHVEVAILCEVAE